MIKSICQLKALHLSTFKFQSSISIWIMHTCIYISYLNKLLKWSVQSIEMEVWKVPRLENFHSKNRKRIPACVFHFQNGLCCLSNVSEYQYSNFCISQNASCNTVLKCIYSVLFLNCKKEIVFVVCSYIAVNLYFKKYNIKTFLKKIAKMAKTNRREYVLGNYIVNLFLFICLVFLLVGCG